MPVRLPVLEIEGQILSAMRSRNRLVLTAPTGSGKTTQVPQMLLRSGLIDGQILVLQPRRMVTRMAAARVAQEVGCAVGGTVGYQTRHDSRVSGETRIRFLTDGVFLRRIQGDSALRGVGAVILDEFHERSLSVDMSLGLLRRLQESTRPDLKLVVMSATLDAARVSAVLNCTSIAAEGRAYPVEVSHHPDKGDRPGGSAPPSGSARPGGQSAAVWDRAADALRTVLDRELSGDVLVFMPGAYEIRRTIEASRRRLRPEDGPVSFYPLHASLSIREQDAATMPSAHRKVIVSTNVAETSLTIEGVRHVIDSGRARLCRFDANRGLNVLLTGSISRASANQRSGRAGRTAPGTCIRLWSIEKDAVLPEQTPPAIQRLDLSECVLQLKAAGVEDLAVFPWVDTPDAGSVDRGLALLQGLRAVDDKGALTETGRRMAALPMHPRLSRMLLAAESAGCVGRVVVWTALISEREILVRPVHRRYTEPTEDDLQSDLVVQERAYRSALAEGLDASHCRQLGIDSMACRDVSRAARQYRRACRDLGLRTEGEGRTEDLVRCLLAGYFDHVAMLREEGSRYCAMEGQRRVELDPASVVKRAGPLVALDVRETERREGVRTIISKASALDPTWLADAHPDRIEVSRLPVWNEAARAVEEAETHTYDGLVFRKRMRPDADPGIAAEMLVARILSKEIRLERWGDAVEHWIARVRCVGNWFPEREIIRYDEEDIRVILHEIVEGATRYSQIRNRECLGYAQQALSWPERQFVGQMTPTEIRLPSGFRMKVAYDPAGAPKGRAKIQDLYGLKDSPTVAGGRQKLLLEILGPNFRPVQVTDDLKSFWEHTYPELKKVLRRRYPRHEWR